MIEAIEEYRYGKIVLDSRSVPVKSEDNLHALLEAVRRKGLVALPWQETTRRLQLRAQALSQWMPEINLPDVSEAALLDTLEQWLAPYLQEKRKLSALTPEEVAHAFNALLTHDQHRMLDEYAPETLLVPSSMRRQLIYALNEPPILAVKLQELFGLVDTPRIAEGRVTVMLHLLSPAGRPIQVTQDLKGFWERTYPQVKKELKGRYPRHPWPENPWLATATHRVKIRGRP